MILRIVFFGLLSYGSVAALVVLFQGKMIFPATREVDRNPLDTYGWAYEELYFSVMGHTTHAWFVPLEDAKGTILFSHGNAGNIADRLESVGSLRALGFNVLVYDYGGYGYSTGRPSEKRCYEDIRAMWRYLTEERGLDPAQIVLFGRSLGGGMTTQLATEVAPAAVVLESIFLSTRHIAREMMPWLPVGPFIRHVFDNASKVTDITSPLLMIHSPDDTVIPYHHGQELFRRASEPKQFLEIHGDHNDGFVLCAELRRETIAAFLAPFFVNK